MSFTYDPNLADSVSQVRSLVQDTIEVGADFQDEEIQYFLAANNDQVVSAAREAAFRLYVLYAKKATTTEVDGVTLDYRGKADAMKKLYEDLKKQATTMNLKGSAPIIFGGIDASDFEATRDDSSTEKPYFTKDAIYRPEILDSRFED